MIAALHFAHDVVNDAIAHDNVVRRAAAAASASGLASEPSEP